MCKPHRTLARATLVALALLVATSVLAAAAAGGATVLDAVKGNDGARLRGLLADGADPNEADSDGTAALHWAVHQGQSETVAALLTAGAAVDAPNRYGVRPLYLAVENGDASMVRALLEAGADPNGTRVEGETALMIAARTGDVATLEALIAAGADVNVVEERKGQTALMWAAADNNGAAVKALLAAGAERDARSSAGEFTALTFAVRAGALDSMRALLDAGADPDATLSDGTSLLLLATVNAHFEAAGVLLDFGANPNADAQGWTALHQIVWSRRWNTGFNLPGPAGSGNLDGCDLARKLVAHGANVNARQTKEPRDGNRNDLNRSGATPFLLATKSVDLPLMQTLLDLGADPSLTTDEGTSAVMVAAGVGIYAPGTSPGTTEEALAALKLALEVGGGTVNDVNAHGETPLHGAIYRGGALPLVEFLVARGAKLDVVNDRGFTPLRVADGIARGTAINRYPEAAARLREHLAAQGLPVPPVAPPGNGKSAVE
jgi:uncharacterized protein